MAHKSPSSVTAYWEAPSVEDQNGIITEYHLFLSDEETGNSNWTLRTTATQYDIDFLEEYYQYSFTVAAETVLLGPQSSPLLFTTLPDSKLTKYSRNFEPFEWENYSQTFTKIISN